MEVKREPLGRLHICVSDAHRFGTDAFLLAAFSRYQARDVACDLGTGCGIIPLVMERHMPPRQIYGWTFSRRRSGCWSRPWRRTGLPI